STTWKWVRKESFVTPYMLTLWSFNPTNTRWRHRLPLYWRHSLAHKRVSSLVVQPGSVRCGGFQYAPRRMSGVVWLEMGGQQANSRSGTAVSNALWPQAGRSLLLGASQGLKQIRTLYCACVIGI